VRDGADAEAWDVPACLAGQYILLNLVVVGGVTLFEMRWAMP
jgi:hypothetical protein